MRRFLLSLTCLFALSMAVKADPPAPPAAPTTPATAAPVPKDPPAPVVASWTFDYKQPIALADKETITLKRGTTFKADLAVSTMVEADGTPLPARTFAKGETLAEDVIIAGPLAAKDAPVLDVTLAEGSIFPGSYTLKAKPGKKDVIGGVAMPSTALPDQATVKAELLKSQAKIAELNRKIEELKSGKALESNTKLIEQIVQLQKELDEVRALANDAKATANSAKATADSAAADVKSVNDKIAAIAKPSTPKQQCYEWMVIDGRYQYVLVSK